MKETTEAIYQNGILTLLKPLSPRVKNGEKVKLTVETEADEPHPIMELAEDFYEGLSKSEVKEIEKIILDRSNFFGNEKP